MAGHYAVTLECKCTVEVFLDIDLFKLVDLYSGDCVQMAGHLVFKWVRDSTVSVVVFLQERSLSRYMS